jgi:DNA polymerase-4
VTEVIQKIAYYRKASIDEFYLDITGMDRFMVVTNGRMNSHKGSERNRFTDKFALSINKTVSKIGTGEGKPKGHLDIPQNQVRAFLNPLSIQKNSYGG